MAKAATKKKAAQAETLEYQVNIAFDARDKIYDLEKLFSTLAEMKLKEKWRPPDGTFYSLMFGLDGVIIIYNY